MNRTMLIALVAFVMMAFVGATTASAAIIKVYDSSGGSPVGQGWSSSGAAGRVDPGGSGAWDMYENGAGSGIYRINDGNTDMSGIAGGWTLTANVKVNSSNGDKDAVIGAKDLGFGDKNTSIELYDGYGGFTNGAFVGDTKLGTVDPTDGFHTYQISAGGTSAAPTYSFYVDGTLELGPVAGSEFVKGWENEFYVGNLSSGGEASSLLWASGSFESGSVIPEPATLVLFGAGMIGLLGHLRRK